MKIAFIPIDNRPVCYSLAKQIAEIDRSLELILPERSLLGDLKKTANVDEILSWLDKIENPDSIIISLDTVAYGGLIPSRRSDETFEEIKTRLDRLFQILKKKQAKVYAFSSIMRISNNNVNEEEKEYWSLYGKKIFEYSYNSHKSAPEKNIETDVPFEIIQDYLSTRKRNFEINQYYLRFAQSDNNKIFETLVYSKDDCAKYGFNVAEAQTLKSLIDKTNANALIKTGADEIPLSLLSRALTDNYYEQTNKKIKICPFYTNSETTDLVSKYEDISVENSVSGQIELAGCKTVNQTQEADIVMFVNNFENEQGEIVMGVQTKGYSKDKFTFDAANNKPFFITDILNANGADNNFVKKFFENNIDDTSFLGYAAWNTTGNTLGSAICCAIIKYLAKNKNEAAFKKVQTVRFLDDWAYQANVRQNLKSYLSDISVDELKNQMKPFEKEVQKFLKTENYNYDYDYPWQRFFEIEVLIK